jgi:hypothetical protein
MPPNKVSLQEFGEAFEPWILERAKNYWQEGKIDSLEIAESGYCHAQVVGTEEYDVDIRLRDDVVMSVACTCPYVTSVFCKHVGAVLFELQSRLGMQQTPTIPPNDLIAPQLQQAFVQWKQRCGNRGYLFLWNEDIASHSSDLHAHIQTSAKLLSLEEAKELAAAPLELFLKEADEGLNPNIDTALHGMQMVVDNAMFSTQYEDACDNLTLMFHMAHILECSYDDSDGIIYDFVQEIIFLIRVYIDMIATFETTALAAHCVHLVIESVCTSTQDSDPSEVIKVVSSLLSLARWDDAMLWGYEAFSDAEKTIRASLRTFDVDMNFTAMYDDELMLLRHDLYAISASLDDLTQLRDQHGGKPTFVLAHVAQLIEENHLESAQKVITRHLAVTDIRYTQNWLMNGNYIFDWGMLPHGWTSIREGDRRTERHHRAPQSVPPLRQPQHTQHEYRLSFKDPKFFSNRLADNAQNDHRRMPQRHPRIPTGSLPLKKLTTASFTLIWHQDLHLVFTHVTPPMKSSLSAKHSATKPPNTSTGSGPPTFHFSK